MKWIALALGLGLALVAAHALLSVGDPAPTRAPRPARTTAASDTPVAAPRAHIDEASREALRDILREADEEEEVR